MNLQNSCSANINRYYIYIYLDPRKPGNFQYDDLKFDYEPFYVGKGHDYRIKSHLNESRHAIKENIFKSSHNIRTIIKILKTELEPIIFKLVENLPEEEAYKQEKKFIKLIGRYDLKKGPLTNKTDGGEGLKGYVYPQERKEVMSKLMSKEGSYWFGKRGAELPHFGSKWSETRVKHMSKIMQGERNGMFQKTHTAEVRKKLSDSHKGVTSKKYKLTSPTGEIFYAEHGLAPFCEKYNLNPGKLSMVANNHRKKHKGWKCEFIDFVPSIH